MDDQYVESRRAVAKAREALRLGDRAEARIWAERAAELTPDQEDPWLVLAAIAGRHEGLDYIKKALELNPDSPRARKGMEWAMERPGTAHNSQHPAGMSDLGASGVMPGMRNISPGETQPYRPARSARKRRSPVFPALLFTLGCIVVAFAAWSASTSPALASILSLGGVTQNAPVVHPQSWARAEIAKPTYTLMPLSLLPAATSTATLPLFPTDAPLLLPPDTAIPDTAIPDFTPFIENTATPEITSTPGTIYAEIVPDTPTSEYVAPTAAAYQPAPVASGGYGARWIDVDLSQQRVYAFEGDTVVNSFLVSTGTWQTPTVTGKFSIWIKLRSTTMAGPGYYLPNVPYTMYFYKGYGLHGTYWHNNFGTPMSHGCVNLSIPDAEWLYNWASVGTVVNVHY